MPPSVFDELQTAIERQGAEAAFSRLADALKSAGKYHELFDARLMQSRRRLGLPIVSGKTLDELDEPVRSQMETAYLDACREVGRLLLAAGKLREGWMYLRPVGDKSVAAEALLKTEPQDTNIDEIIELAVHEGIAPKRGFELILQRSGTCSSITAYEATMRGRPLADRRDVAALLVRRVYDELSESLRREIQRQEGKPPAETSIEAIVADRDWLFADGMYHIDTSHLNAVVRFAEVLVDPEALRLAVGLAEYGRRLSAQFQYAGEEPFADPYVSHGLYFQALLGQKVDEALSYFAEKATLSKEEHGTAPLEVYVALLAQVGRHAEAQAAAETMPAGVAPLGFAPHMLELARSSGDYDRLLKFTRGREDLLGFTAGLVEKSLVEKSLAAK
ncbi:MAG: hypothetical protein HYS13_23935 [Planctomycetia bacterium]|nr:hypothetical protein [Planctomycetia bacterium]